LPPHSDFVIGRLRLTIRQDEVRLEVGKFVQHLNTSLPQSRLRHFS